MHALTSTSYCKIAGLHRQIRTRYAILPETILVTEKLRLGFTKPVGASDSATCDITFGDLDRFIYETHTFATQKLNLVYSLLEFRQSSCFTELRRHFFSY